MMVLSAVARVLSDGSRVVVQVPGTSVRSIGHELYNGK